MKKVKCCCGKLFTTTLSRFNSGRGKYCSNECKYKYRKRPIGLTYIKHKINSTSFKKGDIPWNKNIKGLTTAWNKGLKGIHFSPRTEFKEGQYIEDKNINWTGDDVGYGALHTFIIRRLGKAKKCVLCGDPNSSLYVWHNKSMLYKRDLNDWEELCHKCHMGLHAKIRKQLKEK